jgi:large subunit ribosomal protein L9
MDVILKEDIGKLGKAGEIIKVKDGYARNYLIPKGLALELSPMSLKIAEAQRESKKQKEQDKKEKALELAETLANASCTVAVHAGEDDKIFGTVTHADLAESLKNEGVIVDKKDISLDEEVHKLGIYYFTVKLHPEVSQRVKLWVVKK